MFENIKLRKIAAFFGVLIGVAFLVAIAIYSVAPAVSMQVKTFRIVYERKSVAPDGAVKLLGKRIRFGNTLGEWKETSYDSDGNEISTHLHCKEGRFWVRSGERELLLIGSYTPDQPRFYSSEFHKQKAIREERILGYTAYVKGDERGELWGVPEFGFAPLKIAMFSAVRNEITEAVEASFEQVPAETFTKPNWPVSTQWLQDRIKVAESGGNAAIADDARKELEKWKGLSNPKQ